MAEKRFALKTPDGFKIHGIVNKPDKKKNTKAIIHIHGLACSEMDHSAVSLAQTLPQFGYDVIRVNLYDCREGGRSLLDCTIKIHAADINRVVKHFSKKYKKLFATGHSYGGPSLMTANINAFAAVSLWDPTYLPSESFNPKEMTKLGKYYLMPEGIPHLLGKKMVEESKTYDRKKSIALAKKCTTPLQVIYAEYWLKEGESFHTYASGPTDEKKIPSSGHFFYEEGTVEKLLKYTKQWFDKF